MCSSSAFVRRSVLFLLAVRELNSYASEWMAIGFDRERGTQ